MDFYEGRYDLLLCTTIIENGIDIQRANTLIVYDANTFGLSQLYQLRGRVGKAARWPTPTSRAAGQAAQRDGGEAPGRHQEFTEFGSGFGSPCGSVHPRAGNILGPEQSGQVSAWARPVLQDHRGGGAGGQGDFSGRRESEMETGWSSRHAYLPDSFVPGKPSGWRSASASPPSAAWRSAAS